MKRLYNSPRLNFSNNWFRFSFKYMSNRCSCVIMFFSIHWPMSVAFVVSTEWSNRRINGFWSLRLIRMLNESPLPVMSTPMSPARAAGIRFGFLKISFVFLKFRFASLILRIACAGSRCCDKSATVDWFWTYDESNFRCRADNPDRLSRAKIWAHNQRQCF